MSEECEGCGSYVKGFNGVRVEIGTGYLWCEKCDRLRDMFAAAALTGLLAKDGFSTEDDEGKLATVCYEIATEAVRVGRS